VAGEPAWHPVSGGLALAVRLTPRGGRDALEGVTQLSDGRSVLAARVRAAPESGSANAALVELIAAALKVRKRDVELVSGSTSRLKTVHIAGDAAALAAALERVAQKC
jgi:uncharacterized protein (TIGR00251 family)